MKVIQLFFIVGFLTTTYAKINVVTTTTNLADIVRQIGGSRVDVISLCKGVQDPHYLEAKPSYTFKLSKANLLVSVGGGLEEGWLPLVVRGSRNPDIRINQKGRIVAANFVSMLDVKEGSVSRSNGDVHPEGNPHFMLGPSKALVVAKAIAKRLISIDPRGKKEYQKNLNNFSSKISSRVNHWKSIIKKNTKVISYHKTLTYFYNDFNIQNIDVLEPKPGVPPTASHILKLIKKIKARKVNKIIVENYFDETIAKRIKRSVPSVDIYVVPVAVNGKSGIDDIFDLYDYLAKSLGE